MKTYKVARPHIGDRFYETGDTREAAPIDVKHLVDAGILVEVEAEPDPQPAPAPAPSKAASGKGKAAQ